MDVAAFVIGCVAFVLAIVSFGWQVFTWKHAHRLDVRVRFEPVEIPVGEGRYPITVVIENFGATQEAVQEVWLQYAEHDEPGKDRSIVGPPSLRDRASAPLAPRRNVRRTYDLLGGRFTPFPSEVTAVAVLESGERVVSEPYRPSSGTLALASGHL